MTSVRAVWAIAGFLCAVLFKTAPEAYAGGANFLLHTDMYRTVPTVGWGELMLAVIAWWVLVALLAGVSASLYNRLLVDARDVIAHSSIREGMKA